MNETPVLELRDIHMPPPPGFWPPAPGWWVLTLLVLLVLAMLGWLFYQHYRRWHHRRDVLRMLTALQQQWQKDGNTSWFLGELSVLLRRIALFHFSPPQVAGLSGLEWLQFLDDTGGEGRFTEGPGKILTTGPYALRAEADVEDLCVLAREWIKRNA